VRRWLVLLVALAGCDETTLLLELRLAGGLSQPGALRLALYHDGLLHRSTLPTSGRSLPGTLIVRNLHAGPGLRVQIDGLDGAGHMMVQAAEVTDILQSQENRLQLTLAAPLADADGDGVPDVVDDCPERADADQRCSDAADAAPNDDLGHADLARLSDLSGDGGGGDLRMLACPVDALLCDDFESGDDSHWNAGIEPPKPQISLAVDGQKPHAGNFSLHANALRADLSGSWNRTSEQQLGGLSPPFAVRFWLYSGNLLDNFTLVTSFRAANDDSISVGGGSGVWTVTESIGSNSDDHLATLAVPIGQWTCVELVHDGTQVHLYTDNLERVVFAPTLALPIDKFTLGVVRWPAQRDNELFFDDLILARSRVGCP
jgi:hypothetical protein